VDVHYFLEINMETYKKRDLFPVLERDLEVPVYLSKVKQGYILRKI
jgi:hypothetical protein